MEKEDIPEFSKMMDNQDFLQFANSQGGLRAGTYGLISDLIEKGDFIRLQSLSIGYNFKTRRWPKELGISSFRVYAQAQNLFCLTGYSGFDPEINSLYTDANLSSGVDSNTTPLTRTITFGVNVSF